MDNWGWRCRCPVRGLLAVAIAIALPPSPSLSDQFHITCLPDHSYRCSSEGACEFFRELSTEHNEFRFTLDLEKQKGTAQYCSNSQCTTSSDLILGHGDLELGVSAWDAVSNWTYTISSTWYVFSENYSRLNWGYVVEEFGRCVTGR